MSKIVALKMSVTAQQLCHGFPMEFVSYFERVAKLRFDEEPDYAELRGLFRELFVRGGMVFDYAYDWSGSAPRQVVQVPQQPATQPVSRAASPREAAGILKRADNRGRRAEVRVPKVLKPQWSKHANLKLTS
jgi:hypothetical protein